MLANVLAVLLGLGSFTFYMTAFVYPEVHRRSDFLWSALGMFYALVLWFCAAQMGPSVLLGQAAAVTLLLGLGWQTLTVRRQKTPVYQQTPIVLTPEVMSDWAKNKLNQLRIAPAESVPLRLEKRSLRSDPRRRPVYDYEFVEDGILESVPKVLSEAPALRLDFLEKVAEPTVELDDTVPPSAEAEIISIEVSPQETVEPLAESVIDQVTENTDPVDVAESEAKLDVLETEVSPFETSAAKVDSLDPIESAELNNLEDDLEDDWGDDFAFDDADSIAGKNPAIERPSAQPPATKKPSLLATPLILIGWFKDVIAAATRPKPARPVIDIPRRERADRQVRSPQSTPDNPTDSQTATSWPKIYPEESNWDD
jgi:Ycf66 protein N-terminus